MRPGRALYMIVGVVFVALGTLGAFLPVLPTTPFLLVSLWAFANSSSRLERWLLEHRRFGPRLVAWRTHRVIPLAVKLTAWASMAVSLLVIIVAGAPWWALLGAAAIMVVGASYIARQPSRLPTAEHMTRE
jgi:hypothetical protein